MRVYLAGPDVFFPAPIVWAARRAAICAGHGLIAVSPFDPMVEPPAWATLTPADRTARRNEAHIRSVDAVIANLTPFRGPSADVGTVYEVGFARGLGLPVYGYTTTTALLSDRTGPGTHDTDGLEIERFGLLENLMIDQAVREAGVLIALDRPGWNDLDAFTACVAAVAG